nr:4928_t:CDS:2 [Entrophospora candida]
MTPLIRPYQRAPEMFGIPLKYITVFLSELSKFLICLYYAIKDQKIRKGYRSPIELFNEVFAHDAWKLVVPAVLYTIQNNLQYIAILGLTSVVIGCVISGIASVYFEKVLKGTPTSIWIRNVQLSFFSLFPALVMGIWWKDAIGDIVVVMEVKYGEYT